MAKLRALIVDDEIDLAESIAEGLARAGFEAETADGGAVALRRGAFHYLTKPFGLETLRVLVERACRERAHAQLRRPAHESLSSHRLLGQSPPMRQLRALIERVAAASSPVLISGETGTGK